MNFNPFSLDKKLIIITGASSGIGRSCAIACSRMGASVILFGRNSDRLEETLAQMENRQAHSKVVIDLLEYEEVAVLIKDLVKKKGRINGLINCAGISTTLPVNAFSPEKAEHFFRTNVIGAINLTKHVVRKQYFSEEGGSIIFLGSVMGVAGEKGKTLYSMTKGALLSATKPLSIELASRKVRVNCISPGVVESPMSKKAVYSKDKESIKLISEMHPLGLGKVEDVANACIYLLSDASSWVTGTNLVVDGGYLAR